MEINRQTLSDFRYDFMKAMMPLEEKYDVMIMLEGINYEKDRFSGKVTVRNGRTAESALRVDFDADVWKYKHLGFDEGMYNRIFLGKNGRKYAIQGFRTRAPKYPLIVYDIRSQERIAAPEGLVDKILDECYLENTGE